MTSPIRRGAALLALAFMVIATARSEGLQSGYDPGQLYNLANAYARAGQPGLAVLTYERAQLLAPTDEDIQVNLRRVRDAAHVSPEARSSLEVLKLPNPPLVEVVGLMGLLFAGLSGIAWRRGMKGRRWQTAGVLAGASLMGLAACNAVLVWPKLHAAVVIAADAPVRAAPALLGDALFVAPEAETVEITAEHEDFVLVKTQQGKTGWMARAAVALVVPRK
jgi:hypothetical protein